MKSKLKSSILGLAISIAGTVHAQGIPVFDSANVQQNIKNHLQSLAEMAKQLAEAKNQVEQLKANVDALSGVKGFSDILQLGGFDPQITATMEDLLKGNTSGLTDKAKAYFDALPSCNGAKDKNMCEQVGLAGVAQMDFAEKMNDQIHEKLKTITELSERAKQAPDMKSMAELQAQITLEGNSIAALQLQADNFAKAQEAQRQIVAKQAKSKFAKKRWESITNAKNPSVSTKDENQASKLLN